HGAPILPPPACTAESSGASALRSARKVSLSAAPRTKEALPPAESLCDVYDSLQPGVGTKGPTPSSTHQTITTHAIAVVKTIPRVIRISFSCKLGQPRGFPANSNWLRASSTTSSANGEGLLRMGANCSQ